jgi:hypothetical protein
MAWYVRGQARETRDLAETSEAQLEELRRSAAAAEPTALHGERTLAATSLPQVRLMRIQGEKAAVYVDGDEWSVTVENSGPVPATIIEAEQRPRRAAGAAARPESVNCCESCLAQALQGNSL